MCVAFSKINIKLIKTMTSVIQNCVLKSLSGLNNINLPHDKEVIVGRDDISTEIQLQDLQEEIKQVSRKHLSFIADLKQKCVKLKVIGVNCPLWNGYLLQPKTVVNCNDGDVIELICGLYTYQIHFEEKQGKDEINNQESNQINTSSNKEVSKLNEQHISKALWSEYDNGKLLIYTSLGLMPREKIAGFDIDGTLINTKSGAKFAKSSSDWKFAFSNVKQKLKDLQENNYKLVFFTNQAGLSRKIVALPDFKIKIEDIVNSLGLQVQIFIATGHSVYRKPCTGMWETLIKQYNDVSINLSESFYVGDAAGRPKESAPTGKRDHSVVDRLFALNLGLKFYTPEEFFLGRHPVKFNMPEFDPRKIPVAKNPELNTNKQEVILMVGGQGSGKSYYCENHIIPNGYEYINRDKLGTWQKCISLMEQSLINKKSIVIDNTNGTKEARKRYLDTAKKYNVPVRCFLMTTTVKHCLHNNKFRSMTDKTHNIVGDMIIYSYFKNYESPTLNEGFTDIVKVSFNPEFKDNEKEKLYKCFLLEN